MSRSSDHTTRVCSPGPQGWPRGRLLGEEKRRPGVRSCVRKLEAGTYTAGNRARAGQEGGEPAGWEHPSVFSLEALPTSGVSSPDMKDRGMTKYTSVSVLMMFIRAAFGGQGLTRIRAEGLYGLVLGVCWRPGVWSCLEKLAVSREGRER